MNWWYSIYILKWNELYRYRKKISFSFSLPYEMLSYENITISQKLKKTEW